MEDVVLRKLLLCREDEGDMTPLLARVDDPNKHTRPARDFIAVRALRTRLDEIIRFGRKSLFFLPHVHLMIMHKRDSNCARVPSDCGGGERNLKNKT
jgi:hypothetical protein